MDQNTLEAAKQILQNIGLLSAAVLIVVNALKALGVPGKAIPVLSILLGIGGAYLTVSHSPGIFVIVGVLASATETAVYSYNQSYFQKKYEEGQAPAQETEDPVQDQPTPPAPRVTRPAGMDPEPEL